MAGEIGLPGIAEWRQPRILEEVETCENPEDIRR